MTGSPGLGGLHKGAAMNMKVVEMAPSLRSISGGAKSPGSVPSKYVDMSYYERAMTNK